MMEMEIMEMLKNTMDVILKTSLVASLIGVVWNYILLFFTYTDFYLSIVHFIKWMKFIISIIVTIIIMIIIFIR